jgi:hypothetical protein
MRILVSLADILVLIYMFQQKYWLGEYICIGIGWTHIDPTTVYRITGVKRKFDLKNTIHNI